MHFTMPSLNTSPEKAHDNLLHDLIERMDWMLPYCFITNCKQGVEGNRTRKATISLNESKPKEDFASLGTSNPLQVFSRHVGPAAPILDSAGKGHLHQPRKFSWTSPGTRGSQFCMINPKQRWEGWWRARRWRGLGRVANREAEERQKGHDSSSGEDHNGKWGKA